jgi:hypothetical protein
MDQTLQFYVFFILTVVGHSLPTHSAPVPINVRFAPLATKKGASRRMDVAGFP